MAKLILSDAVKAKLIEEQDRKAADLYGKLNTVAAEVFAEKGSKRKAAVDLAAGLVTLGYSLRSAAKAAGMEPNNGLQRYFEVAKAMLAHEEQTEGAIAPPEGFSRWADAVAAMPLEDLCESIRERKPTRERKVDHDKVVRAYVNAALDRISALVAGEAEGKTIAGLAVGSAQVTEYVKAWLAAGMVTGGALDALPLTPLDAPAKDAVTSIREKLGAMLAADPAQVPAPAVVNE